LNNGDDSGAPRNICLPGNLQIARVAKYDLKQIHRQTYTDRINELNKNKLTKLNQNKYMKKVLNHYR